MGTPRPRKPTVRATSAGAPKAPEKKAAPKRHEISGRRHAGAGRELVLPVKPDVRSPIRPIRVNAPATIGEKSI